ncbi:MAG: basic amino acid ABC transporter substrate-binding protein [Syntrophomonadaceae bacterium]|nr:basic amino acid ABC transporter substrate-binding protein [Syntrophomonadaceae bacterium]
MKKYWSMLLIVMLSISILAVAGCGGEEKEPAGQEPAITKLVVGSETAYAPFEMVDEKTGDYIGFDMDIIKAIGEAMGVEVEIRSMEFTALIPALENGQIDCAISAMSITEDRQKVVDFAGPYYDSGLIIAVDKDTEGISTLEDLEGKPLGAQIGTTGADACLSIQEKDPATEVKTYDHVGEAFMELQKGGVVAVINDFPVTDYYVKTEASDTVKTVGEIFLADDHYGIPVQKGDTATLDLINEGLAKIRENGTYDEISAKWFE